MLLTPTVVGNDLLATIDPKQVSRQLERLEGDIVLLLLLRELCVLADDTVNEVDPLTELDIARLGRDHGEPLVQESEDGWRRLRDAVAE
jgi:hypothetical protein